MLREMIISGLTIDPVTNSPIMILKEPNGDNVLPIWIGLLEATAIACELEDIKFSRPMTHDLFKNTLEQIGVSVTKIEVCDLRDNTYYARIYLRSADGDTSVDARPSDAIAIALRTRAPIFIHDEVIRKSKVSESTPKETINTKEGKKWTELLQSLKSDDFGKYKM
jgi:uncharacterized protein